MRVLLINKSHKIVGGADTVYFNTGNLLIDNGHDVAFFSVKDVDNKKTKFERYFTENNLLRKRNIFTYFNLVLSFIYNKKAAYKLSSLINDFQPDLVHLHLFYGVLTSSILDTIRRAKLPCVLTIHDYKLICPVSTLSSNNQICTKCFGGHYLFCAINKCSRKSFSESLLLTFEAYFRNLLKNPVNYVDEFIFVSKFSMQIHLKWNESLRYKCSHLYNFVTDSRGLNFRTTKVDIDFLYFGRLSREKGLFTLVNVFKLNGKNLKIIGSGPIEEDLRSLASNSSNIEFISHVSQVEILQFVARCRFVIVPSEWYENNPMSILESFSLGKPVIGAKIGGIPELIADSINGYLFESSSVAELSRAVDVSSKVSRDEYDSLSLQARESYLNFYNDKIHYKKLISIYNKVMNK